MILARDDGARVTILAGYMHLIIPPDSALIDSSRVVMNAELRHFVR